MNLTATRPTEREIRLHDHLDHITAAHHTLRFYQSWCVDVLCCPYASIDHLKQQAKALVKRSRGRVRLGHAQLYVAQLLGYRSWPDLKHNNTESVVNLLWDADTAIKVSQMTLVNPSIEQALQEPQRCNPNTVNAARVASYLRAIEAHEALTDDPERDLSRLDPATLPEALQELLIETRQVATVCFLTDQDVPKRSAIRYLKPFGYHFQIKALDDTRCKGGWLYTRKGYLPF